MYILKMTTRIENEIIELGDFLFTASYRKKYIAAIMMRKAKRRYR
jgi:hypothetical protein